MRTFASLTSSPPFPAAAERPHMESNSLSLSTIIRNPTVYNPILSCLSHLELVRMARVCRVTRDVTEQYQKAAFNINAFLSPFFDAVAFRSLQCRTHTLIGGSFASCFLERSYPHPSIDLLVYPDHCEEIGRWLIDNGYHYLPLQVGKSFDSAIAQAVSDSNEPADSPIIRDVLVFRKPVTNATSVAVSVLVAVTNPLEIVFNACSTCFFSVVSWRRAYCLFPRATLHNHCTLLLDTLDGPLDLSQTPGIAAYMEKRGLTVQDTLYQHEYLFSDHHSSFPLGFRTLMDSSSLSIELDITDIPLQSADTTSFPTDDVVNACGFRFRAEFEGRSWVDYTIVLSPVLKYSWIMGKNELLYQLTRELHAHFLKSPASWLDEDHARLCQEISGHLTERNRAVLRHLDNIGMTRKHANEGIFL